MYIEHKIYGVGTTLIRKGCAIVVQDGT